MNVSPAIRILLACTALGVPAVLCTQLSRPAPAAPVAATPAAPAPSFAPIEQFVKTNCVECHGATKQKGEITLHTYHDEASVLKDRKTWEAVLEKIQSGEMPPKKKARPNQADSDAFVKAVEGIFYRHDLVTPRDPGQVTIRRLNRTEYYNTVRDLVGVDVHPAEDFPS